MPGAQSCDCPDRPNSRPHSGHVQAVIARSRCHCDIGRARRAGVSAAGVLREARTDAGAHVRPRGEIERMSQVSTTLEHRQRGTVEHFDVLIVGAGISGIGAAYHMQDQCPASPSSCSRSSSVSAARGAPTRYPGIRSDSDLYTFGYRFKPWTGAPIASAEEILKYMGEVIEENDLAPHIRYHHAIYPRRVVERRRAVDAEVTRTDRPARPRPARSPPTSCGCARATTSTSRATRPSGPAWTTSRVASCIRRRGPTTSNYATSGSS